MYYIFNIIFFLIKDISNFYIFNKLLFFADFTFCYRFIITSFSINFWRNNRYWYWWTTWIIRICFCNYWIYGLTNSSFDLQELIIICNFCGLNENTTKNISTKESNNQKTSLGAINNALDESYIDRDLESENLYNINILSIKLNI